MLNLLRKEFRLSMHETVLIMMCLVFMVLIPNYPYVVIFFYTTLATYFTCLGGRENNDIVYTMMLPIAKKDVVKARIGFTVCQQMIQIVLLIPFIIISGNINASGNQAGLDPSIALIGVAFFTYGVSNLSFFTGYYKNVNKVGKAFLRSCVVVTIVTVLDVVGSNVFPIYSDVIDVPGMTNIGPKMIVLAIGIILYIILTVVTYKKSVKLFLKQDL